MSMSMVSNHAAPHFERLRGHAEAAQRIDRREQHGDDEGDRRRTDIDSPGRRNPLVGALMQALKALMAAPTTGANPATPVAAPPAASAAPSGPAVAGVEDPTTTDPANETGSTPATNSTPTPATSGANSSASDLKEAAYAFANELFSALRNDSRDGDRGRHQGHHHGHHGRHDRGGYGGRSDYGQFGGLVQRLQGLASSLGSAAATSPSATSAAAPEVSDTAAEPARQIEPAPSSATPPPVAPGVAGGSLNISISINISLSLGPQAATPTADSGAGSPLLKAFEHLMEKLGPAVAGATDSAAAGTTSADKLKTFLLGMADALKNSGDRETGMRPGVGSLINLAA